MHTCVSVHFTTHGTRRVAERTAPRGSTVRRIWIKNRDLANRNRVVCDSISPVDESTYHYYVIVILLLLLQSHLLSTPAKLPRAQITQVHLYTDCSTTRDVKYNVRVCEKFRVNFSSAEIWKNQSFSRYNRSKEREIFREQNFFAWPSGRTKLSSSINYKQMLLQQNFHSDLVTRIHYAESWKAPP